jgi:hypothetical protein
MFVDDECHALAKRIANAYAALGSPAAMASAAEKLGEAMG